MPFSSNTVIQLRDLLRARMLSRSGRKAELINRLVQSMKSEHGITKNCHVVLNRVNLNEHMGNIEHEKDRGYDAKNNGATSMTQQKSKDNRKVRTKNSVKEDKSINSTKLKKLDEQNATNIKDRMTYESMTLRNKYKAHQKLTKVEEQEEASNSTSKEKPTTLSKSKNDEPPKKKMRKTASADIKPKGRIAKRKKRPMIQQKKVAATAMTLKPALQKYEMVWAHIKGFKNWPGIIEEETPRGRYKIHFFGDYSTGEVSKNNIMHLMEGYKDYASMDKPTPLLVKAITEAQIFVLDKERTECPICKMLKIKKCM